MLDFTTHLRDDHVDMIVRQSVFFVATAAAGARINLSPKGYDSFRVLSPHRVAWIDLGGSGNETNAHLLADGRVTVMMCNFEQPAAILRIYGRGRPVLPADPDWDEIAAHFPLLPGTRQIFDVAIESVQVSCGWGVPTMALANERTTLTRYHAAQDPEKWVAKFSARTRSIDGLPARPTDRYIAGDVPGRPGTRNT